MVKGAKGVAAVVAGLALLAFTVSCGSTSPETRRAASEQTYPGFLGEYAQYIRPGSKGEAKMHWLKPGVNFGKYNKLMLESVTFFIADDSPYKGIDPVEMRELADLLNKELVNALDGVYPIVAEPGPDVVRVRIAITNLEQGRPVASAVTAVTSAGPGRINVVKKGATGSWVGSGMTRAECMIFDSMTDEVIAVAREDRSAKLAERSGKWGSAEEACRYWAERIKNSLDKIHGLKQ
ncbi:MAG TPA: DUF3313 domain-containing protein [Syntrophobacteria bacterium]|nr:DUF3313 domain-containing protein [Syntrophobacteria bacterium]